MAAALDVLIIGAGFAGLGMAMRLKASGIDNFELVEQADGVGGTWWANRYPGAACDIPSLLYSLSFAPNPNWTRLYPQQSEIQRYLASTARRFGITPKLRLSTRLESLAWDAGARCWQAGLCDDAGTQRIVAARAVVAATGGLSRPRWPEIEGLHSFEGRLMHTARWQPDAQWAGQRVGVIGTGASAIQIVPELARDAAQLTVFQRSAPWIVPRGDRELTATERWLCTHVPGYARAWRSLIFAQHELRGLGFTFRTQWLAQGEAIATRHRKRQLEDPALREAAAPRYRMGCKRILISDDYYPALKRPNVTLVTDPITRIEPRGVRGADGRLHEFDVLVAASGFEAAEAGPPCPVIGVDGRSLADDWRNGASAYLGTMAAGYPNLFFMVGPNTGLGHNSMVYMIESQIAWVLDALRMLRRRQAAALDVQPAAHAAFDAEMQQRLAPSIWATGGCTSWYKRRDGRMVALWPGTTLEFRRRTKRVMPEHFRFI